MKPCGPATGSDLCLVDDAVVDSEAFPHGFVVALHFLLTAVAKDGISVTTKNELRRWHITVPAAQQLRGGFTKAIIDLDFPTHFLFTKS